MKIRNLILPPGGVVVVLVVHVLLVGAQFGIDRVIEDRSGAREVVCTPIQLVKDGNYVKLKVDCDGREVIVSDPDIIISYVNNPGPLQGTLYRSGRVVYQPRPPKE